MTGNHQKSNERKFSGSRKIVAEVSVPLQEFERGLAGIEKRIGSGIARLRDLGRDLSPKIPMGKSDSARMTEHEPGVFRPIQWLRDRFAAPFSPGTDDARTDSAFREARRLKGDELSHGEQEAVRRFSDLMRMLEARDDHTRTGRAADLSEAEPPRRNGFFGTENPLAGGRTAGDFRRQTEFLEKIYNILERLEQ